ncbi:MAG TPA: hypothetical protein VGJ73_17795 [Verrucomicrobiae bacterium]|jgi:hypothetical protein
MTYLEAKEILRDAVAPRSERDLTARLMASAGRMSAMDTSTAGDLPAGDSYADQILRALLVVRRHIAGQHLVEHDLLGILLFLDLPVRVLASESQHSETRIPQISLILDAICMSSMSANTSSGSVARRVPE